ncbi:hypothetical protein L210DRAFT_3626791 [Boletus edulis BED1]|uniref:Uncharacterized protein n=1 Tax=Boletus edulis BED1 TaxID=1328754 RepID=A0AAD4GMJ1_BOLED|nr:hypothetical protein L210DRAFT_3626791 [Boletus edulis BED1]
MATLRRSHTPVPPWGAEVEQITWEKSRSGTPRRRRMNKPPLMHDPGWDWDGRRILFSEETVVANGEERDCEICVWEDENSPILSGRTHTTLSLLDIARYQATKRRGKARSGLDDFEVIRVPKVMPVLAEEPDIGDSWELGEWEKLDALGFKRTYSEVARGLVDGKDPPNASGCSGHVPNNTEDDSWECL